MALEYIFYNNLIITLIQCDADVKGVCKLKNMQEFKKIKLKGFGGTTLQPGIDYIVKKCDKTNLLILTDGYTDQLDLSKIKHKVLIASFGENCPISKSNGKLKQIILKNDI